MSNLTTDQLEQLTAAINQRQNEFGPGLIPPLSAGQVRIAFDEFERSQQAAVDFDDYQVGWGHGYQSAKNEFAPTPNGYWLQTQDGARIYVSANGEAAEPVPVALSPAAQTPLVPRRARSVDEDGA